MKVLWLSPTPCGSIRKGNQPLIGGGWLISLEDELKKNPEIELEVAFFSSQREDPYSYDGVVYYPMGYTKPRNSFQRILDRRKKSNTLDKVRLSWMIDVIEQSKPDLIHIHGSENSFVTLVPHIKNLPVILSIQGMLAPIYEKYFSGISKTDAEKVDTIRDYIHGENINVQYKSISERMNRETCYLQKIRYIIGRTYLDFNYSLLLNPNRKYFYVSEILRPQFYNSQWKGYIENEKIKIITIVSGAIYKGIETIFKTANLLVKYASFQFEWYVVGYDSNSKLIRVAEKITGVNHKDCNLLFQGRIGATRLCELLCASDVYVNTSHIENSPNSVCEAMLVGIPIIASYAGGTASIMKHEEDGVLVQEGDPYSLAGAITNFFQNPDKAKQYAISARKKAMIRHNVKNVVNDLINCYNSVVNDFRGL